MNCLRKTVTGMFYLLIVTALVWPLVPSTEHHTTLRLWCKCFEECAVLCVWGAWSKSVLHQWENL